MSKSRNRRTRRRAEAKASAPYLVTIPLPDGVAAKIVWAERHFDLIKDRVGSYVKSDPYVVEAEFRDDPPQWPGLRPCRMIATPTEVRVDPLLKMEPGWVGVARLKSPVPSELPLMVGDFIHNLRSALDHLARGLVVSNGGDPIDSDTPSRNGRPMTTFPATKTKPTSDPVSVAGGIAPPALAIIEGLQPYKTKPYTASKLFLLNELWNIDKHRQLQTLAAGTGAGTVFALVNHDLNIAPVQPQLETFYDGAVLTPCPIAWPRDANVSVNAIVPTQVVLEKVGPGPEQGLVDLLQSLLEFVRQAVAEFQPFFTAPWPPGL